MTRAKILAGEQTSSVEGEVVEQQWRRDANGRLRARGIGLTFDGNPGPVNAISDVPGVLLGVTTLISGEGAHETGLGPVRSGVTAILPRGVEGVGVACAAGVHSQNGNGELTGAHWINESGTLNTPIMLTNTHALGAVHRGVIDWVVARRSPAADQWLLPVVGETWDGYLNDINGDHVRATHAVEALDRAGSGLLPEGSVGGGTGMNCYGFKGGNGTASRLVSFGARTYTLGVFLQANFGARHELSYRGLPVGRRLSTPCPMETEPWFQNDLAAAGAGSCIAVVATDAPLLPDQARALARRVTAGLARTGTSGSHFSGDIFLAFSTANEGAFDSSFPEDAVAPSLQSIACIPWGFLDPFFEAVVQASEEAVWNALVANETMFGRNGHVSYALAHDELLALLALESR